MLCIYTIIFLKKIFNRKCPKIESPFYLACSIQSLCGLEYIKAVWWLYVFRPNSIVSWLERNFERQMNRFWTAIADPLSRVFLSTKHKWFLSLYWDGVVWGLLLVFLSPELVPGGLAVGSFPSHGWLKVCCAVNFNNQLHELP